MYGSIEAGGTKFVCAVGDSNLEIIKRVSFPTTEPGETMAQVIAFFREYEDELESIGVGSFGPIDIQPNSKTYGYITGTPKLPWQNFDFVGTLKASFDLPVAWTTDVNSSCYGEYIKGHGQGLDSVVYFTIGTGVGGGALQKGTFTQGFSHPEMGHLLVRTHPDDDFAGTCPSHGNCLEGMACGLAIEKRMGKKAQELSPDDPFWDIEADYIAQCAYTTTLYLSPDIIIFGGGVMKQEQLLPKIREAFARRMNGYVKTPDLASYIVTPALGDDAGTIGCLALAREARLHS